MTELLIYNISQLVTCAGSQQAKRGLEMRDVGQIENGAVAIADGLIVAVGSSDQILADYPGADRFDASGRAMIPGFVDPHTGQRRPACGCCPPTAG